MKHIAIALLEGEIFAMVFLELLLATLVVPVFVIYSWYSNNMERAKGGASLKADHEASGGARAHTASNPSGAAGGRLSLAEKDLKSAGKLIEKILSGAYGEDVRKIQVQTYW